MELNSDGHEAWRSIESFLETLHLTGEDRTIRYVANQWRNHYDVPVLHCSAALHDMASVLPHPEHSNISFGQPVSVIPNHTAILQACWGRSAFRRSQGDPAHLLLHLCDLGPWLLFHLPHLFIIIHLQLWPANLQHGDGFFEFEFVALQHSQSQIASRIKNELDRTDIPLTTTSYHLSPSLFSSAFTSNLYVP